MLKFLRKKGVAKKILWVIAGVIIISFSFFGIQGILTGNGPRYAGKIFGKNISFAEFDRVYRDVSIQAIIRYGDNYSNVRPFLNLESQTWDRLILLYEAKKRNIKIKNEEVVRAIEEYPFFQRNGQFDTLLYNDILRYVFKTKPRDFEESIRDTLKFSKIFEQETANITLQEDEVFAAYKEKNEKIQVSYAFIPFEPFKKDVVVDEAQAQQYYTDHKLDFLLPETINVEYIELKFPETADASVIETIRKAADSVFQELVANPNIREVAGRHNLEVQISGFFSAEQPNLELGWSFDLLSKIFKLDVHQISGPFETAHGYHILQVIEKRNSSIPDYAQIKDKVTEIISQNKAIEIARQKSNEYLAIIKTELEKTPVNNFSETVKAAGLEIDQTPLFTRGQYLPKIGISNAFEDAAFGLNETSKISGIVQTTNGFCILHLDHYEPASREDFEKKKQTLGDELLADRRSETFNIFLNGMRTRAKLVDYLPN